MAYHVISGILDTIFYDIQDFDELYVWFPERILLPLSIFSLPVETDKNFINVINITN